MEDTKPAFNPPIDETTAVALSVLLNNQIASLQAWERKIKRPFMPAPRLSYMYRNDPVYPTPTLATALHVVKDAARFELEVARLCLAFTKQAVAEREKA